MLHPDLAGHVVDQGLKLPKRTLLYEYRLNCDFVSMLWARDYLFKVGPGEPKWHTHLRIDSSPQFNKNFLVGEVDRICIDGCSPSDLDNVFLIYCREKVFSIFPLGAFGIGIGHGSRRRSRSGSGWVQLLVSDVFSHGRGQGHLRMYIRL